MTLENLYDLAQKLKLNEYDVEVVNTKEEANKILLEICNGKFVSISDSHTIEDLNVYDEIKNVSKELIAMKDDKSREKKLKSMTCDVYILSANAVSLETGEMVNIDSSCNRVASSVYGPEEVVFVIGKNKIEKDLVSAINRIKNFVAPKNAKAHNYTTPCVFTGKCENCFSKERICRTIVIYQKRPKPTPTKIILVNEDLGW